MAHRMAARWLVVLLVGATLVMPVEAGKEAYRTGFSRWRAADGGFAGGWALAGVALSDGCLTIDAENAVGGSDPYAPGGYYGGNYYNGGTFIVGEATGPAVSAPGFAEAVASWNADTPPGTWIETQIRAQIEGRWTKWYSLGVWVAENGTVARHSIRLQGDADGYVAVDTLVLTGKVPASAFQLKLRLFSDTEGATPTVRNVSLAYSTAAPKVKALAPGDPANWNTLLDVPQCSQMVYEGGNVWCSATSTSMIVGYWTRQGDCASRVEAAVDGVYDWIYDGTGNWPFNAAYAATYDDNATTPHHLEAYVARLTGFDQVERWVKAGVPVAISYAWKKSSLDGAPVKSSDGHLAVIVGFDSAGNPVVNDPAAPTDGQVQRVYDRTQLETDWLESSAGTVYLIYPQGMDGPALP